MLGNNNNTTNNNSNCSDTIKPLPHDFQPGPFDVICGRGKTCYKHPGNLHMRKVVENHVDEYARALTKDDKSTIVTRVVHEILTKTGQGGFVKQYEQQQLGNNKSNDNDNNNNNIDVQQQQQHQPSTWYCVPFPHAREKIGQAFRDLLHDRYKSSIDSRRAVRQQANKRKESSSCSAETGASPDEGAAAASSSKGRWRRPAKKLHALSNSIVSPSLLLPSPSSSSSTAQPTDQVPSSSLTSSSSQLVTDITDVADLTSCLTRLSVVLTFDESFSEFMEGEEDDDDEATDHAIASFFQQQHQQQQPPVEATMTGHHGSNREAFLPRLSLVFSVHDTDYTLFMEQGMEWLDKPDEVFSLERLNAQLLEIDNNDRANPGESASFSTTGTPFEVQRRRDSTDLLEAVTALQACFGNDQDKYERLRQSITRSSVKLLQTVLATDMLQGDNGGCTSGEQQDNDESSDCCEQATEI